MRCVLWCIVVCVCRYVLFWCWCWCAMCGAWCAWCVCGVCGVLCVVCVARLGTRKKNRVYAQNVSVCRFKTPPCVPAKRPHLFNGAARREWVDVMFESHTLQLRTLCCTNGDPLGKKLLRYIQKNGSQTLCNQCAEKVSLPADCWWWGGRWPRRLRISSVPLSHYTAFRPRATCAS